MSQSSPAEFRQIGNAIGEQERDAAIDRLASHFSSGQLSETEFDDRIGKALNATTDVELQRALSGLAVQPSGLAMVSSQSVATNSPWTVVAVLAFIALTGFGVHLALGLDGYVPSAQWLLTWVACIASGGLAVLLAKLAGKK